MTVQQDATIYSLFICVNCSTCFGWYLHLSSGAHVTVFTASGISKTVTATCRELVPDAVDTVTSAPDDEWRYHPKHVERITDINKLYIVASCWTIIGTHSRRYSLCLTSTPPEQIMRTSEVEAVLEQVSARVSSLVGGRSFQNLRRVRASLGNWSVSVSLFV